MEDYRVERILAGFAGFDPEVAGFARLVSQHASSGVMCARFARKRNWRANLGPRTTRVRAA